MQNLKYKNVFFLHCFQLKINQTDYFGNYLRLLERSARQSFSELGQFHNQSIYVFRTRATTVNAFYAPRYNTMGEYDVITRFHHKLQTNKVDS